MNVRRYATLVREKSVQRNLIRICSETIEASLSSGATVDDLIEAAEKKIFELRLKRTLRPSKNFKQILASVFSAIDGRYHSDNREITGMATGFGKLDEMTAGFQRGDLIIIAGRPSMGKTAMAMNVAEHVGIYAKRPVAVFSIEMTDEQLAQRMLGSVGRVDQHKLRTGRLTDADWSSLNEAMNKLHQAPFLIEETTSLSIVELRARARRIKRDNPDLALIIVDYLQLMASQAKTQSERTQEIGDISRGLKALAKELDLPMVALSQLNRGVEQRINKRPMMSDLRDSGSIEQDADLIVFLYRDEVYHEESASKGYAEAIVGKQRNGAIGTVHLRFVREETRFESTDWIPPRKERKRKQQGFVAQTEKDVAERHHEESES